MTLQLQNINGAKISLNNCNTAVFTNSGNSFSHFTTELKINRFRHLIDVTIPFEHPVTVITGTNKIGKTSILLLLACSFEKFLKIDSTSSAIGLREHGWSDVLSFTSHENESQNYSYEMKWRVGSEAREGEGKRLATSKAWSGLGKRSADTSRVNAKIRGREVRLIDLERILPGRSFSNALYRKANSATAIRLNVEVEQAFSFVFDLDTVRIAEVGTHINKSCFLITRNAQSYSSYNAASGEESVICLLKDLILSPPNSLILIDEVEAGFHPSVQRKLADVIQYISWRDKKQFVITTHSPTFLSALPARSRRFIESTSTGYRVIRGIAHQAARSKMDSVGHPLVRLYCEDELAEFLILQIIVELSQVRPFTNRLIDIIKSGPVNDVKTDYERHKRNLPQYRNRVGYCAVIDGDHKNHPLYSSFFENPNELVLFLYPYEAPEKFLVRAYLTGHPNAQVKAALEHSDHHSLFQSMVNAGLATDLHDARSRAYSAFKVTPEFSKYRNDLSAFLVAVIAYFSELQE